MNKNRFWIASPHLSYETPEQSEFYLSALSSKVYYNDFHKPFRDLVSKHSEELIRHLGNPPELHLFDLGPGYPDKTLPLMKKAKEMNLNLQYLPFDISKDFLEIATDAATPFAQKVVPIHGLFENASQLTSHIQPKETTQSLVFLGLTFMNFSPEEIRSIFNGFKHLNPFFLIGARLLKSTDQIDVLLNGYKTKEAMNFAFGPLKNKGCLISNFNYSVDFNTNRVETIFTLNQDEYIESTLYRKGDSFITTISQRYRIDQLEQELDSFMDVNHIFKTEDERQCIVLGQLKE